MKGIETLTIVGVAIMHCVKTSVRDTYQRDYNVIVVEEAVAGMDKDNYKASLRLINKVNFHCIFV
jgi:nicotinamidase-related amidase